MVMRRQLLTDWDISARGRRSEVSLGYRALLAASSIGALSGFGYRRSRPGNMFRPASVYGTDKELLTDFEEVFAFLDAHRPTLDDRRGAVSGRIVRAATQRLHRMPAGERRSFAKGLCAGVASRTSAADLIPPGRLTKLRM